MNHPLPHGDAFLLAFLERLDERSCLPGLRLEELVDGALPLADADRVRVHLGECLSCLHAMARIQSLRESPAPPDASDEARGSSVAIAERDARLPLIDTPSARALRPELYRLAGLDRGPGAAPSILIVGERGTGKNLVAQAIHALSRRASRPFVQIPCWALPEERMEVEMFGDERATVPQAQVGLLERADGGTLLLDGVHRVPLDLQLKLLAALEEQSVRRLGGGAPQSFEARVIAVTDADLDAAVSRGLFRADLLHRLEVTTLRLAPLRERPDDIVPLARHFLEQFSQERAVASVRLSRGAEERLFGYHWPGNVLELSKVIRRAAAGHGPGEISAEELQLPSE